MDKTGAPVSTDKIMYGQSFVIYCMSECALATGNAEARATAEHTFDLVQKYAADTAYGGYREMFLRDWQPRPSGAYGGDRKSFDVHMHLMEAYTTLYELTRAEIHRRKLLEVIDVLWSPHVPRRPRGRASRSSPSISRRCPPSCSRPCGARTGTTRARRGR